MPADLGFYDLRLPESREAQANLAREHGIPFHERGTIAIDRFGKFEITPSNAFCALNIASQIAQCISGASAACRPSVS